MKQTVKFILSKEYTKYGKLLFPLIGLLSLIWFLVRVIPKPGRAAYPCMRVAAPLASSFVLWLIGLSAMVFSFKKMKMAFRKSDYGYMVIFMLLMVVSVVFTLNQGGVNSFADTNHKYDIKNLPDSLKEEVTPNNPIGVARGINPGAVVWVWNPEATNETCTNTYDDAWFLNKNNNQTAIDSMLSAGIKSLANEKSDSSAWGAVFTYFNKNKHGREAGYAEGEKVFIKINATSAWPGNIDENGDHVDNQFYGIAETSPQVILALLRQLINNYGIPQGNISIGDPLKNIYNNSYNMWHSEFPDVHYLNKNSGVGEGRELIALTDEVVIFYSDKGTSMSDALSDKISTAMYEADYLINVPAMKAHALAGVTLFAKNHFGSHGREHAVHLHAGLVTHQDGNPIRSDSGLYRVQADLMGHEKLGGNQVLFLLDALWSGGEAVDPPSKWDLPPFNYDWTSSLFLSQDMVAIESVAFDFLYAEYNGEYNSQYQAKVFFPHMKGTTDYLRQAASSEYWPEDIVYDPENDGTPISSLGVNEHWNNSTDKQYSRNLGTGDGINLIFIKQSVTAIEKGSKIGLPEIFRLYQNYPNPFNPSTTISFALSEKALVRLTIYDLTGSIITTICNEIKYSGKHSVTWDGTNTTGTKVASGNYIYTVEVHSGADNLIQSGMMTLLK
jgi:hypothetical protein